MGKKIKTESAVASEVSPTAEKESSCDAIVPGTLSPIAHPLADAKLYKKILKTVTKGIPRLVILAGDVSPMDVLSHLPVLCEDNAITYVFVPSKSALGLASSTLRPTCCIMLPEPDSKSNSEYISYFEESRNRCKDLLLKAN
ncbi:hypothetical protein DI09_3p380 [Mitosporidium daphniae]|uniref:Ribosomal protein eL8/eL30/eS12/Gadd45 domain-containing protein n=1 Tax=Mitosporidium daphniae TaxID=1485682 RepID=A0A098VUA5_9MICR|nr:uncharacterized protein DI09_3p380 [Mitosporidium daphniae]KGG51276.1 hypothetical protein DI09_3p380 [Mitosporidium daphniae]|eukprot:XP_013237703.1 uncharacterized protein DI09_3p380 [Mitosporidium daphniae]